MARPPKCLFDSLDLGHRNPRRAVNALPPPLLGKNNRLQYPPVNHPPDRVYRPTPACGHFLHREPLLTRIHLETSKLNSSSLSGSIVRNTSPPARPVRLDLPLPFRVE